MSQSPIKRLEVRAIFAAMAVCALVFSLFVSGAVQGAHAAQSSGVSAQGDMPCHQWAGPSHATPDHKGGHSGKVDCLAAQAAAAVLPDRLATFVRPLRIASSRVSYSAFLAPEPETAISNAVNGARAPPAKLSLS